MGMTVKVTTNEGALVQLAAVRQKAMITAAVPVLVASNELAPREETPRHGVHLDETGFVRLEAGLPGGDRVAIGYEAFWAFWQHEDMGYHHEHGVPKFLELAMLARFGGWLADIAAAMREA